MSVAIDTHVLIWGLQSAHKAKATSQNVAEMKRRSRILLQMLADAKETVVVSTVVVAELLVGIALKDHGQFIAELQQRFLLQPFDLRASSVAAALWQTHAQLPKDQQIGRKTLKADVLIIATAKVAGVRRFYSHEPKFRNLVTKAGMEAHDLPTHYESDMFLDQEIRREAEEE